MASPKRPNAKEVGDAFKDRYYHILQNLPEFVHGFYEDNNKIPRPQQEIYISRSQRDGTMRVSTISDIDDKDLKMLTSGGFDSVEVTNVTSQDSYDGGVFVIVDGYFISKERPARKFVQTFFLAPQDTGYFVLNDMFRFVGDLPPKAKRSENDSKISFGSVGQRNGNSEVYLPVVAEGEGICIQNIPLNVTIASVKEVLKKFGSIKRFTVRSVKNYCDCLVEFEEADAAEMIIKASPLLIDGHISQVEKKLPYCASLSEVRESKDNPFRDVWEKLRMRARVYGSRNWEKIMDQLDTEVDDYEKLHNLAEELTGFVEEIRVVLDEEKEKQKLENIREEERKKIEEEGRQDKQSRYRSHQMKETQGVDQIQKEQEEEEEEQNEKVEGKLQEEEGRQYKQSRFRSKQMKEETQEAGQIQEEEEEQNEKVKSKLQEEAEEAKVDCSWTHQNRSEQMKETEGICQIHEEEEDQNEKVKNKVQEVDFSWTYEEIMEVHREFEEEMMKIEEEEGRQYNQNRYRSPEMKERQEVAQIPEEEEETAKVESKLKEEEGRQNRQSRFRSKQLKEETLEVCQIQEEEEEHNEKAESKLQEEAEETKVDLSWTHEDIMELYRKIEEEDRKKIEEEGARQYKQKRYRSEQMKETQRVCQIQEEEEDQNEKVESKLHEVDFSWTYEEIMRVHREFEEEQMKIEEEEGRQYNQNRYRSPEMKETREVAQIPKDEENEKVESNLQEEGKEKEVDYSWTCEQIMEEHRVFEEQDEEAFTYFCQRMKMLEAEQQK